MKNASSAGHLRPNKITILGSGVWGLAIAGLLAKNGQLVTTFSKRKVKAEKINQTYSKLVSHIVSSSKFKSAIKDSAFIFIAVPSNAVLSVLKNLARENINSDVVIIICSKGIDSKGLQLFSDCAAQELPKNNFAIMSGPNFASEVSESLPTTTTIASGNKKIALKIVNLLKNDNFLPIISNDIVSAQIFGSIKNIFAIGCGIIDGLKLGENAKAALVLKGILEAELLIKKLGGNSKKSFISPCGLGDLFLTCSSKKSRNNSLGILIGKGVKVTEILSSGITYEGFNASSSIIKFAKKHHITLPLCEKINQILHQDFTSKELKSLISNAILSS